MKPWISFFLIFLLVACSKNSEQNPTVTNEVQSAADTVENSQLMIMPYGIVVQARIQCA